MARGWYGNSDGHRKAGRLGGLKSAESRRRKGRAEFGEQLVPEVIKTKAGSVAKKSRGAAPVDGHLTQVDG